MAANLGPVPPGWQSLNREQLEALLVTTTRNQARHKQLLRADNMEDYLHIGGPALPTAVAAERLGVCKDTIYRFRAILCKALTSTC